MASLVEPKHIPEPIAAYQSLDGAVRAAAHLVELGYNVDQIAIAPKSFRVVAPHPLRRRLALGVRYGGIIGGLAGAIYSIVALGGAGAIVGTFAPALGLALLVGISSGVLLAAVRHHWVWARTFETVDNLVPTRFEITVQHVADDAQHDLAQWWDPTAPPLELSRSA